MVHQWTGLPDDARALYARLFSRKDRLISVDGIRGSYPELPEAAGAVAALDGAGFAWTTSQWLPLSWHLSLYDRSELSAACRRLGLRRSGTRAVLESRLLGEQLRARALLNKAGVRLRHRGLMRRLCRAFLGRSDGDLRSLVMHRVGVVRFADYTPATGAGPYPDRRSMVAYERAREWAQALRQAGEIGPDDLARAIAMVADAPAAPPAFRRFRARRYGVLVLTQAAEAHERARRWTQAAALWRILVEADAPHVARRLALCLERSGAAPDAVRVCVAAMPSAGVLESIALARTGRRLARRAGIGWRPSPPLRSPPRRRLRLTSTGPSNGRPTWSGLSVERAVAAHIQAAGRVVIRGENLLWTTLFGTLLRDVVFAPVAGMLSGALQAGPLDLGQADFGERRSHWLEPALAEVEQDAGAARLHHAFEAHLGEVIWGVTWTRWSQDQLQAVCAGLGGRLLSKILGALAHGAARSGLPDLLVLPGDRLRLEHLFPGRIPSGACFVEVKGPGDQLRDGQLVWLDRLLGWGAPAEVWDVEARPPSSVSSG